METSDFNPRVICTSKSNKRNWRVTLIGTKCCWRPYLVTIDSTLRVI